MASSLPPPSPDSQHRYLPRESDDEDGDTASQRSISLSSPPRSRQNSIMSDPRQSFATQSSGSASASNRESNAFSDFHMNLNGVKETPASSVAPSVLEEEAREFKPVTYPPSSPSRDDAVSVSSFASTSSRKARPESLLINPTAEPLVLGVALVDFNHLVGPRIEYAKGDIFEDDEVAKILPFLALPDGAHLSSEDYSYFHLVKPGPRPTTVFGISCNQQIAASSLLVKGPDVTRSTVQKAVVVLASKPVFGPIREKLRVVTTALFLQRDFRDASILDDFGSSLELSLRTQLTESGLYMGTSIRDLVHTFRQKTLVLVKALILQKRIMFYGYPVEKLCTYQYSLVSLLPGLLQTLDDCGSPPLAARAPTLAPPTSLRTSDQKSMLAFMGLPLDIFGKDSFFQPYLPLQQIDMIKNTPSWLCGCTNSIICQQSEIDLLVNIETGVFEFRDARLERSAGLTPADRKWMDDILTDVHENWHADSTPHTSGMQQFKGSDDYLRSKFEEYVSAALSSVKYRDFIAKGENGGVMITGGTGGNPNSTEDFNPLWISEFKRTNAYAVWERITDPLLFDIVEPRHPCNERPSVVADIGLRLQEGIQELKLEQQLAPAREAVARTLTVGSTSFFKAVEGVRERWTQRTNSSPAPSIHNDDSASRSSRASTPPVEVSKADIEDAPRTARPSDYVTPGKNLRPFSLTSTNSLPAESPATSPIGALQSPLKPLSAWGTGFGSFLSAKTTRFSMALKSPNTARPGDAPPLPFPHTPQGMTHEQFGSPEGSPLFNGMSPGISPTGEADAMAPASIASVLSASMSEQTVVPSISVSDNGQLEKHEEEHQQEQETADEGFKVL
ncbi:transport protein Avl9-domain-containing protein [Gymnopilus junonius]|uniref:Transport protein Avl9-domain-containing protein n=1 Tax=Gymnopilus junonius TaxID=109634 RepID=A0A9P5NJZ7_GYMJU|nr:transport protein Avl9-domain-containing protein [Gymnopilus junonius]